MNRPIINILSMGRGANKSLSLYVKYLFDYADMAENGSFYHDMTLNRVCGIITPFNFCKRNSPNIR